MTPPDGAPAYESIKKYVKKLIDKADLGEGDLLPSEHSLAVQFGVSRSLARQALRELEIEGYVERSQGKRSRVAPVENRLKPVAWQGIKVVALAFLGVQSRFTQTVVAGFTQRAAALGYHTLVYNVWLNNEAEFEFLRSLQGSGVAGMAAWLHSDSDPTRELLKEFASNAFPFVQIDRYLRDLPADMVVTDNVDVGRRLTHELLSRGHTRIAVCDEPDPVSSGQDRLEGYRLALEEAGIAFIPDLVVSLPNEDEESARNALHTVLAHRDSPTAFLCINEYVLSLLVDELEGLGYRVPADFELAVVDDSNAAERLGIPVVRAVQQAEMMGRRSAELLVARIAHPLRPVERELLRADVRSTLAAKDRPAATAE